MDSQTLWSELLDLLEQARNEFSYLRDLPAYGRKQWERYFQKAFQVYARLWAFQQDNRCHQPPLFFSIFPNRFHNMRIVKLHV